MPLQLCTWYGHKSTPFCKYSVYTSWGWSTVIIVYLNSAPFSKVLSAKGETNGPFLSRCCETQSSCMQTMNSTTVLSVPLKVYSNLLNAEIYQKHVLTVEQLRKDGTFVGNDVIAAFARENNVDIIVHQHSSPRFAINAPENPQNIQLHLAYHNGEHYSSLRRIHDTSDGPANIQNGSQGHTPQKQCQVMPIYLT